MQASYTQCRLTKKGRQRIAWIPSKYAIEYKRIRIRANAVWKSGWMVAEVYGSASKERIEGHERDNLLFSY